MKSITTLKIELEWVITEMIAGYKVSPLLIARTKALLDVTSPYYNEDLVEREVVALTIDKFKAEPDALKYGMAIEDGVLTSEVDDGEAVDNVLAMMREMLDSSEPEFSATIAFITKWSAESYLKAA